MNTTLPVSLLIFLTLFVTTISAQSSTTSSGKSSNFVINSYIYPTSPFYGIKLFKEKIELTLSLNESDKLLTKVRHSRERIIEADNLLSTLRFDEAYGYIDNYRAQIKLISKEFDKDKDDQTLKIRLSTEVQKNLDYLESLARRYPEKQTIQKTFRSLDDTRSLHYQTYRPNFKVISPMGLDDRRSFNVIVDIREINKFNFARIPGSVHVETPNKLQYTDIKYYAELAERILGKYREYESILIVGDFTSDSRLVAEQILDHPLGANKEIFVLEMGFVNYAMFTDYPVEGLIEGEAGKPKEDLR